MGRWLLAVTSPGCEARAARHLEDQGFRFHHFRIRERQTIRGKVVWRIRSMFPRYVFVHIEYNWHALLRVRGIVAVVKFGENPAVLSENILKQLLTRCDSDLIYKIDSGNWASRFIPGDRVRVNDGPLVGYSGVFDATTGEGRVRVLLEMLGAQTPVVLDEISLLAVG